MLTISAVVLLHLGVIAVLVGVNGCRTTTGFEKDGDLGAYTGASGVAAATPAYTPGAPVASTGGLNEAPKPVGSKPAVTATPRPVVTAVGKGNTHTVAAGESLWVIARREGVSLDALCAANGLERNAVLRVGQKIVIPDGSTPAPVKSSGSTTASGTAAPTAPAAPSPLAAPAGGFGGFGPVTPAPAAEAPKPTTTAPAAPVAPKPAEPAKPAATSPLAAPAGGFGGFGAAPAAPTAPATR